MYVMKRTPLKRKTPLKAKKRLSARPKPKKAVKTRKKNKKPSMRQLKDKLWKECRRIIIERHGNNCFTCGNTNLSGSGLHCGHFISSSICSVEIRYSLENLRPQCYACNIHRSGNWVAFERNLLRDGIDVEALKQRNEDTKGLQYDSTWYLQKIEEYRKL